MLESAPEYVGAKDCYRPNSRRESHFRDRIAARGITVIEEAGWFDVVGQGPSSH